ncbi:hypothetical protein OUY22_23815 [Nonomuraea sp. MCN248]|uniref:Streptomyces killer toxin-like beta/gamma crystallin domain-containing protein n=1 Tax=Nonomuraea corallina TaxID=2989783 RepID=A0ABT4SGW0_9ACTN|nr:hypothetical protein [Nonomuraea corallina]MDA0636456.1 hypothetical protein [Nonomuraea corallina]
MKAGLAAMGMATAMVLAPAPASAASGNVGIMGCQSTSAVLTYTSGGTWSRNCSGTYQVGRSATKFSAGGWSGYVTYPAWPDGHREFCDFQSFNIGSTVTSVTLYATKAPWCP